MGHHYAFSAAAGIDPLFFSGAEKGDLKPGARDKGPQRIGCDFSDSVLTFIYIALYSICMAGHWAGQFIMEPADVATIPTTWKFDRPGFTCNLRCMGYWRLDVGRGRRTDFH